MKPSADFKQAGETPLDLHASLSRLGNSGEHLQQGRFAGAISSDHAHGLATFDLKAYILERPELFDLVASDHLAAVEHILGRACKILRTLAHCIAQCAGALAAGLVANLVGFAEPFH